MMRLQELLTLLLLISGCLFGCGTTHVTDTPRSASEELLISRSIDQSVGELNFIVLSGQTVFLDTQYLGSVAYKDYLISSMRQHLLANGCRLTEEREHAQVIVEARAGSVATSRHDMLVGLPRTTVPFLVTGVTPVIPELALLKKTTQIGVAKISVFAYRVDDGAGIWQSGVHQNENISRNCWILGLGPHQSGDVVLTDRKNPLVHCLHRLRRETPVLVSPLEIEAVFTDIPEHAGEHWQPATVFPPQTEASSGDWPLLQGLPAPPHSDDPVRSREPRSELTDRQE